VPFCKKNGCGLKCKRGVSGTDANPGRVYYHCPLYRGDSQEDRWAYSGCMHMLAQKPTCLSELSTHGCILLCTQPTDCSQDPHRWVWRDEYQAGIEQSGKFRAPGDAFCRDCGERGRHLTTQPASSQFFVSKASGGLGLQHPASCVLTGPT
jgi:hypothetical protein